MYNELEKAIHFATIAHSGQKRIKENIDIIFHPYSVSMMIKSIGLSDDYVILGLLHDIIEDTDYTYNDIKNSFGKIIADNVLKLTEDRSISNWVERKKEFISRLEKEADVNILYVECADKLHNLLSDYELFNIIGKKIFDKSLASYDENKWYYGEILKLIKNKCKENILTIRYEKIYNCYFGD